MAAAEPDDRPVKRSNSLELIPPSMSELRVVLLGGSWSQRSSVGKFILEDDDFSRQQNTFKKITVPLKNKLITVINTPDLPTENKQAEFIRSCARLSDPGPHVFLLVLQPEEFTEEKKNRMYRVLQSLSERWFDHSLLLILKPKQESLPLKKNYMKDVQLRELIRECRYRYIMMEDIEREELLTRFGQIAKENNGEHVSDAEPGEGSTSSPDKLAEFIEEWSRASAAKHRVFLLGLQPEDFTKDEKNKIYTVLKTFSERSFDLKPSQGSGSNEDFMNKTDIKDIIKKCEFRCLKTDENLQELLSRFEQLIRQNDGEHVGPGVFQTAKVLLQEPNSAAAPVVVAVKDNDDGQNKTPDSQAADSITEENDPKTNTDSDSLAVCSEQRSCKTPPVCGESQGIGEQLDCQGKVGRTFKEVKRPGKIHGKRFLKEDWSFFLSRLPPLYTRHHAMPQNDGQNKTSDSQAADSKTEENDPKTNTDSGPLRIVLVGKTGSGKSSSGNTILGTKKFTASASPQSVTTKCQSEQAEVNGQPVVVVDTPGLFDNNKSPEKQSNEENVKKELIRSIRMVSPGPHVFLLVMQIGRFTPIDSDTFRLIEKVYGEEHKRFTIILFTGGDVLEQDEQSIQDYIEQGGHEACKKLINECGGRYHVFNNYAKGDRSQVSELIKMINTMVKENGGSCYTIKLCYVT